MEYRHPHGFRAERAPAPVSVYDVPDLAERADKGQADADEDDDTSVQRIANGRGDRPEGDPDRSSDQPAARADPRAEHRGSEVDQGCEDRQRDGPEEREPCMRRAK